VKTLCSMKSISPSNICALLAKWRYSAASLTPSWRRKGCRGDTLSPRLLQHGRQGLQDLLAPLTRLQATARDARVVGLGGLGQ
jgi:hypothetical protein